MVYLNNERRHLPATLAALSALAVAQLILIAPASAHVHAHHRYPMRREAAPAVAWNFAQRPQSFNGNAATGEPSPIDSMAASAASAAGIPVSLVERVIKRESGGHPRAVSQGNYGLMQIRLGTARAMGYSGSAEGLLDAQTNMTYAVKYLAGAYRAAGGNENRAVALYASGYYAQAKVQDRIQERVQDVETTAFETTWQSTRQSSRQSGLYAYAPAYPSHFRARHSRHHAV